MDNRDKDALDDIKQFYDSVYYKDINDGGPSGHERRIARRIDVASGEQVLDVACGTGNWLRACIELGASASGIDLSSNAVAHCKSVMPEGEFYCQPAEKLPFADATFDIVSCLGSLEHFVQPENALGEMMRVAKPGARILLLVPNSGFLTRRLGLFAGTYQVDAREVVRSLPQWSELFENAGMIIESRWKDLHVVSRDWILQGKPLAVPLRLAQAIALPLWPLDWQYQVYFMCRKPGP